MTACSNLEVLDGLRENEVSWDSRAHRASDAPAVASKHCAQQQILEPRELLELLDPKSREPSCHYNAL